MTTVTLNAGETVTMSVGAGDAITATGAGGSINCGATTTTVDQIAVFGTDVGNETLIIDEGVGGRFEPGLTADLSRSLDQRDRVVREPRRGHRRPGRSGH